MRSASGPTLPPDRVRQLPVLGLYLTAAQSPGSSPHDAKTQIGKGGIEGFTPSSSRRRLTSFEKGIAIDSVGLPSRQFDIHSASSRHGDPRTRHVAHAAGSDP